MSAIRGRPRPVIIYDDATVGKFGTEIHDCRVNLKWSRREASRRVGISYGHLYMMETGKAWPSLDVLKRICDAYGLSFKEMYAFMPRKPRDKRGGKGYPRRKNPALSKRFGELIRIWRKRRKMSMSDLATQAGVHLNYVSFIERGGVNPPRYKVCRALAKALGKKAVRLELLRGAFLVERGDYARALVEAIRPGEWKRIQVWEKGDS